MRLKILGCSGGIGGDLRTTSMLIDNDILIDAGTGVGDLSIAELAEIDQIFVTHSHLDHIACIPLMIDSVGGMRDKPLVVRALKTTILILKSHIFNWFIWPDFTVIPDEQHPYLRFEPIELGETVTLGTRKITALPADHVVPAVGFQIDSGQASLVFSGDTARCDDFWQVVNQINNLKYLIIETAFSNAEIELAKMAKHFCPKTLADDLSKLKLNPEVFITHLKPGELELTMQEIERCITKFTPNMLKNGQLFEL